jgi:phytoene synthase
MNESINYNREIGFKYAKDVIKSYAKSFYLASQMLPKDKREGAYAVYCFCRYADNIVDNPRNRTRDEILFEIDSLKKEIELLYKYGESEHPALMAFAFTVKEYKIPIKYPLELIEGMLMDLNELRYNSFEELYLFCYRVASTVGLMMCYVLGFKNEIALEYAEKLGIGMQLTNILRDIQEDLNNDRFYLPIDELNKYNLSIDNFKNKIFNDDFKKYMIFNVERARKYYDEAENGIPILDKDARFAIYGASRIYSGILEKIIANDYNPFKGRVFVPKPEKIRLLLNEIVKTKLSK